MESRILGVPLAVWLFVLMLGVVISLPMYIFHVQEMRAITAVAEVRAEPVQVVVTATPTEVPPTATPTARLLAPKTANPTTP